LGLAPPAFLVRFFEGFDQAGDELVAAAAGAFSAAAFPAVAAGRGRAKQDKTEHVIHNQDGAISERNSYGGRPGQPSRLTDTLASSRAAGS
jgi:uncharacterized protein DUF2188